MLNIVLPLAGRGRRFAEAGFSLPKPLIPIHGIPMIKLVIDNLRPSRQHRFIFVCQQAHIDAYDLDRKLRSYADHSEVIGIPHVTEGQACSTLWAKNFFNNDEPLMSANTDQVIDADINEYLDFVDSSNRDGVIMTMQSSDPKWSYAKVTAENIVVETAEKSVISHDATVGIYNFTRGRDFIWAAEQMIRDNVRVNGEFYTCPCFNYLIRNGQKIGVYSVGEEYNGMYGLGTPEDLAFFLQHPLSRQLTSLRQELC